MSPHRRLLLRRAAALSILAAIVLGPVMLVMGPILADRAADDEADAATRRALAGYRREAAARPGWEARITALQAEGNGTAGLIGVSPAPAATAALQGDVRQLVQANGGELRTTQPGNAAPENQLERIEAGFDLTLPAGNLPAFLQGFDAHDPYLFADRIEITAPEAANKAAASLTLHLQVHAYRRPG